MLGAIGVAAAEPLFTPGERIPDGEVEVRVVLIAAEAHDVAQWMLESDGTEGALERRLHAELEMGRAVEVARVKAGGKPGVIKTEAPRKARVILQYDVAHFWEREWYAKREGAALPDPEKQLEGAVTQSVGPELKAEVPVVPDHPGGTVRLRFSYTPEPEERPTTTWPLATLRAPRVMLRPWTVNVQCRMPPGKPVLLGAQMEAPAEGQVNTGKVWLALGQLDSARDRLSEPGRLPDVPPAIETDAMAWVFSVPDNAVAVWLTKRKDSSGDAATLREWVEASRGKDGPVLAGVMHARQESGRNSEVVSRRFWDDGSGFEPGAEGPDYRTLPESDEEYELRHEFSADVTAESVPVSDLFRPVAASASHPSRRIAVSVKFALPPHPARWLHVQSAMERVKGDDPAGMELAAVGQDDCKSQAMVRHGDVAVVSVWPQADHTHIRVAFMRVLRSDAAVVASHAGKGNPLLNGTGTLWMVDTPVSPWLSQLAPKERMDDTGLAGRVVEALRAGKARLERVWLRQAGEEYYGDGLSAEGEGVLVNYLNTHPYAGGMPFNPRYFRSHGPGTQWSWATKAEPKGMQMELHLTAATAATQQRRWGVKLADDVQRAPENSGVDLPVRDEMVVHCKRVVPWNKPVVIAVTQHGKGEAARLRWLIAHCTPAEGFTTKLNAERGEFEGFSYQASLIAVQSADATQLPEVLPDLVAMNTAWETRLLDLVQSGKARLVDFAAVTTDGGASPEGDAARAPDPFRPDVSDATFPTVGAAELMDYLEPRGVNGPSRVEKYDSVPREPLAGTIYDKQIDLREHRNGLEVRWGGKVEVSHGARFDLVTDTLQGWHEYPFLRTDEEAKRGPKTVMVSVQRPVFKAHRSEVEWPKGGDAMVVPWSGSPPPEGEVWFILLRRQHGVSGKK
jgi:hypothetical protein